MKIIILISSALLTFTVIAGPLNMRNEKALKEHQAEASYTANTNYYSTDQFAVDVAAAKNFAELQAVMVKKAKAEQAEKKTQKDTKTSNVRMQVGK